MDSSLLDSMSQLGVGGAAIAGLYMCFRLFVKAMNERDRAFRDYVESNNHKSVEVMTECRDVIREAACNIAQNTEVQKQVVEHLIRSNA